MGGQTCVSSKDGNVPVFTVLSLANPICFGVLLLARIFVFYVEFGVKPDPKAKSPSYGIGALGVVKILLGLGLASSFASTILFFIFIYSSGANSLEFACQAEASYIGLVFPFLFPFLIILMFATNYLRKYLVRYQLARNSSDSLIATNPEANVIRWAMLPSARGNWIPPIVRQYEANYPGKTVEVVCFDAYRSKYNVEGNEWLKANMVIENVSNYQIVATDFTKLPVPDNYFDSVVMPTGNILPYLNESNIPAEKEALFKAFLAEIYRVLKPGGKFISSNMIFLQSSLTKGLESSQFKEFSTQNDWLFWSYIPAKITVATKTTYEVSEANFGVEPTSSGEGQPSSGPLIKKSGSQDFKLEGGDISHYGWFPRGWHWRLTEALIFFTLLCWAGFVVLCWVLADTLQVPSFLPYNEKLTSLLISNATILPFVIYLIMGKLRSVAIEVETEMRTERNQIREGSFSGPYTGFSSQGEEEAFYSKLAVRRILRCYRDEMFDVLLLLTINSGFGWLPTFLIDLILIYGAGMSVKDTGTANTIVSVVVVYLFFVVIRRIFAWYQKIKKEQDEEQIAAAKTDAVTEAVRQTLTTRRSMEKSTELSITSNPVNPPDHQSPQ